MRRLWAIIVSLLFGLPSYGQSTVNQGQGSAQSARAWRMQGTATDGSLIALGGNPILVAGSDKTNMRVLYTDVNGDLRVVGGECNGCTSSTDPVQVAGIDSAGVVRTLATDDGGVLIVSGAGTPGSPGGGVMSVQGVDGGFPLPITGSISAVFTPPSSTTSHVSQVASSATNVTLLSAVAGGARNAATIYNASTAILYVKLGTTASATDYTVQLMPNGYYEVPGSYVGRIDGIWTAANGFAYVTDLDP